MDGPRRPARVLLVAGTSGEAFNVFNHAQFYGANGVNGNISSQTFGSIVNAAPPRICQVAIKVRF